MSQLERYTTEGRQALILAREQAVQLRQRVMGTEHLLLGILKAGDPIVECVFSRLQVSVSRLHESLEFVIGRGNKALLSQPVLGQAARAALQRADEMATSMSHEHIGVEHLLLGVMGEEDGLAASVLESFGLSLEAVRRELDLLLERGRDYALFLASFQARLNETPTLNSVSRDLTAAALAGSLDPLIGREEELERAMQILTRRSKNNPVLIGPAGVGKTAIAEGLAIRIIQGQVPEPLQRCRVVALDVGLLTVGTKFRGDFEERLKSIMREIVSAKDIIIVIDELHALVGAGVAEGSIDAGNLFKPMLARGELRCIGAATLEDYHRTIEADAALERRFQPIMVNETSAQQTLAILRGLRSSYADFHQVTITDEALAAAVQMSTRYISSRYQPDKSIDLLDEAAARVCVHMTVVPEQVRKLREELEAAQQAKEAAIVRGDFALAAKHRSVEKRQRLVLADAEQVWRAQREEQRPVVDERAIAEVVAMWTGIPVAQLAAGEAERLMHLEDELHRRVIGQHEAVQVVAKAVRRARANLRDSHRPIGSFLFVGPTGVGKTELARTLTGAMFGDEDAIIKLDMSEFMESHHAARLVGSPPGYVGYDQPGQLTEAVRRRPYSVVLFDEIEKAHPNVFDLLLQILEDGCLSDAKGQMVDFKNTIIILTSNIGTASLKPSHMAFASSRQSKQARQARAYEQMRGQIIQAVKEQLRPELMNRIDELVVFHTLEQEHLHQIVHLLVARTQQRMAEQLITLHVSDEARTLLVERGYDPVYGARPLRRTAQRMLDDMLAEALLREEFHAGDVVEVSVEHEKLVARVLAVVESAAGQVAA